MANALNFLDLLDPLSSTLRVSDTSEAESAREGPSTGREAPLSMLLGGLTSSLHFVPSPRMKAVSTAITSASPVCFSSTLPPFTLISNIELSSLG